MGGLFGTVPSFHIHSSLFTQPLSLYGLISTVNIVEYFYSRNIIRSSRNRENAMIRIRKKRTNPRIPHHRFSRLLHLHFLARTSSLDGVLTLLEETNAGNGPLVTKAYRVYRTERHEKCGSRYGFKFALYITLISLRAPANVACSEHSDN